MWSEVNNRTGGQNTSEQAVTGPPRALSITAERGLESAEITRPAHIDEPLARGSGIIPGAIAAAVFIGFLLLLYSFLWRCMVSPPKRKKSRKLGSFPTEDHCVLTDPRVPRPTGGWVPWTAEGQEELPSCCSEPVDLGTADQC